MQNLTSPSAAGKRAGGFRPDLQGLRGVAVLLVVLDHAGLSVFSGGYVGVDVFFVLSGFLITGLLLTGAERHGSVSLRDFYARRARRILPAATLTLAATTIVAAVLLNYVRAKQIAWDSFWAGLFAANVRFAHQGTNYFAQGQPPSAVQHYWSLAVEEQFYLVWPAVISLTLFGVLFGRRIISYKLPWSNPRKVGNSRRRLFVLIASAGIASFIWSVHFTSTLPAAAYFSTRARAWELALGAMLATAEGAVRRLPAAALHVGGWIGLVAIGIASISYSATTPFPGYAAALPTAGAALVIASGIHAENACYGAPRLLAIAALRYVGDRSYTFYLWHWPVLVIAGLYIGHNLGVGMNLLLLVAAFGLSIFTYRLFENPIRHARWRQSRSLILVPTSLASAMVITLAIVVWTNSKALHLQVSNEAAAAAAVTELRQVSLTTTPVRPLPGIIGAVRAAERGAKIPTNLDPPPSAFLQDAYQFPSGCAPTAPTATSSTICRLGDSTATKSIVVFGDSHAQMWMPTVLAMAQVDGWTVIPLSKSGCVVSTWVGRGFPRTPQPTLNQCHAWFHWAVSQARQLRPDVILMTGCCGDVSGSTLISTKAGFASAAAALRPASKSVILLADDDGIDKDPTDCLLSRHATLKTCLTIATPERFAGNDTLAQLAASRHFGFLRTRGWFCDGYKCPMVVGSTVIYRDTGHITQAYALRLAVPFRTAFRQCIFGSCP
jgi:peptidoglycan/LPS O-acetylase OafA/YrhL